MHCIESVRFVRLYKPRPRKWRFDPTPFSRFRMMVYAILLSVVWSSPVTAQDRAIPYTLSISTVLADTNGDLTPDLLGDTVIVGGRATVASGVLHNDRLDLFIQDGIGGIRLIAPSIASPIALGDSVVATGVLQQVAGLPQLAVSAYRVIPITPRPPEPIPVDLQQAPLERYEGRLAYIEGHVVGKGRNKAGRYLNVASGDSMIVAFTYASSEVDALFDPVHISDYVSITGIIGQYDLARPYNTSYQIYPRDPYDVRLAGIPPRYYRNIFWGVGLVLAFVLVWVYALRQQVQRRINQLKASETRYQTLFHHAGDALFVYDLQQGISSPILEVNKVASDLLGYPPEAFATHTLDEFITPETRDALIQHLDALRSRQQCVAELTMQPQNGPPIPFEVRSHVFMMKGRPIVLSIARDVTQRKEYEQDLINAKHEAETLAKLKTSFLANMSHEIRTPLTTIIGFADVLAEDDDGPGGELAQLILHSGRRLMDTLNSILDLSRLDANQVLLSPEEIDVVQEVRATVQLLAPLAEQKGLHLRFKSQQATVPAIQDRTCLHRIVNNLAGNAIKFTEHGEVTVAIAANDGQFHLTVRDTGIGIASTFLPHLFDEFKQESTGLTRSHKGSGLGLAITRRLVDMMGGEIRVDSEKGNGTLFTVSAPLKAPGIIAKKPDDAMRPPTRSPSSPSPRTPDQQT